MSVSHPDSRPIRRRWTARRYLRAAAVAVVTLFALYVAALNVFLSTSLFDAVINQDPVTIDIHYRRAWTVLPGRIHASGLSIRSSDSNVEWMLRLDDASFDISFVALARQRFEVTRARGRGISMRARQKLKAAPHTAEEVANLPPIEGFPAFSVSPAGPPSLERWFDEHYALWTVKLSNVIAEDVREVWIDSGRFEGNARISGGFFLKPIREVVVGPARVDARPGSRVTLGPSTILASALSGSIDLTIDRFDPRALEGADIFRHVTLKTDLVARSGDTTSLPLGLPVYIAGEVDVPHLNLNVDRGVLRPGTRVELGASGATVSKENVVGRLGFGLTAEVVTDEHGDNLRAKLDLKNVSLVAADASEILRAERLTISGDARALDLAKDPLADAHAVVDLPDAELRDARVLDYYVPAKTPFFIVSGAARASARIELSRAEEKASGQALLRADDLDVRLAKMRVRGAFETRATVGGYHWNGTTAEDVTLSVLVSQAKLASDRDPTQPKLAMRSFRAEGRSPHVDLEAPLRNLEATFSTPDAEVSDAQLLSPYLPKSNMKVVRGRSRFALDGQLTIANDVARGVLEARSAALYLELGDILLRSALDARARVHDWHWERGDLAVDDATVSLSKLVLSRSNNAEPLASIERVGATAHSPRFALSDPLARIELDVAVSGGKVFDPTAIDAFLPKDATVSVTSTGGTFDARTKLSVDKHVARGTATIAANALGIRSERLVVEGDTSVHVDVGRWDIEAKTIDLGASRLAVTNVRGRVAGKTASDITAKRIELSGSAKDFDLDAPTLRAAEVQLVLDEVVLSDARALQFLVPAGKDALRIASGSAHAFGSVSLSSSQRSAGGMLEVDIIKGAIGINETELAGDFAVRAKVNGFDPDTSTFDLSGSNVSMRNVLVQGAAAETRRWRGDVAFERATLRLDGPKTETPRIDGVVHVAADDARPLLGLLLRDSMPSFVVGLVAMPRLTGYSRLHLSPNLIFLSEVSVSGGDVAVRGSYGIYDQERQGAFIVEKGPLSVGIGLDKKGASPHFFNLDAWLGAHQRVVTAKAAELGREAAKQRDRMAVPEAPQRANPSQSTKVGK